MLNERLRALREEKMISQAKLAKSVGVSRSLYNKYERSNVRPSDDTLLLIAQELETTYEYLVFGNTDTPKPPDAKKEAPSQHPVAMLYDKASADDKKVIDLILEKYQ